MSCMIMSFADFYRGPTVSQIRLAGLDHVLTFTAVDGKVYYRNYL